MKARKTARRKRPPARRFYWFAGIALAVLIGAGILVARPFKRPVAMVGPAGAPGDEVGHNAALIQQVVTVQQAIERYAQAHQGTVPSDAAACDREVIQGGYLAGNRLPDSPWGGHQEAMLAVTGQFHENPGELGPARTAVTVTGPTDLGALCYEALGPSAYRLYGVGRGKSDQAAVIVQVGTPPAKR